MTARPHPLDLDPPLIDDGLLATVRVARATHREGRIDERNQHLDTIAAVIDACRAERPVDGPESHRRSSERPDGSKAASGPHSDATRAVRA